MKLHNNKKDLWVEDQNDQPLFFDNLPELMRPEKAASVLGVSIQTIYDWRYRRQERQIPPNMFIKINRMLYVQTKVLTEWIALQNR